MISRQNVMNTFCFLVVSMILINLYTFVLMMSTMAEDTNHKFVPRAMKDQHGNDGNNSSQQISDAVKKSEMELIEKPRKKYTTIRFVRRNGKMIFFEDPDARPLSDAEQTEIFKTVMRKLKTLRVSRYADINITIKILGRVRRAFAGSNSAFGASLVASEPEAIWRKIDQWPFTDHVFLEATLGQILQFASRANILQAKCSRRGTQLKLNLILEGGQVALFKPRWYPSSVVLEGEVYGGKDRHFGEIAAFYVNQVLGYNNAPLTVGRRLNLKKEILPVSTTQLRSTFSYDKNKNHCFYGVCYYCSPKDPVCAEGELLEGALVLLMNQKMTTVPNPWARTYKPEVLAPWQTNMSYCYSLDLTKIEDPEEFLLDIIAVSIFDFLIGNGDRHHFDVLLNSGQLENLNQHGHSKRILLIDNGKSFGNPVEDYVDILAPLYQCCRLREPLWITLNEFLRTDLGSVVHSLSKADPLYPLLTPEHLSALNERLKIVLAVVEYCIDRDLYENVIVKTND